MASLAGRGRAKIRPPRRAMHGTDVDFETTWKVLERAFTEIHEKNASALSFEELYRNAYKIVLKKKGTELYNKVAQFEEHWLGDGVRPKIVNLLTAPLQLTDDLGRSLATTSERRVAGERFLASLKLAWEDHQVCMGMLTDVLMYMDRVYCTDNRQPSIFAKSMSIFRDQILRTPIRSGADNLLQYLTNLILDQISMDREGERIDSHLIKSNIYMLEGLYESEQEAEDEKLYIKSFEADFLDRSARFYREEGERLLKESDAGTYCRHARRRIDEESDRCRSTLSETTAPKIQKVVEDELIRHKMKGLIEMDSGVRYMVDNDKFNELHLVYDLEARVDPKKPELTKAVQLIVAEMGAKINEDALAAASAPPTAAPAAEDGDGDKAKGAPAKQINQQTIAALKWVEDILDLKDRFDRIWKASFNSDQSISTALTRSMSENINNFARSAEYISLFIDDNMKKGIKDKSDQEVDQILEKAIVLLRYLQDKDYFETYYKKHLCKRLLLKKSHDPDVETAMISRMKMELGNSFTMKLEAMFKDMRISKDLTENYRRKVAGLGESRVDLTVNVLTSMTWPLEAFRSSTEDDPENKAQIIYPPALDRVRRGFEAFYSEKHSGRKLSWQNSMGDVDVRARFPRSNKVHEVNCSTYAALILLLFNDLEGGTLSLEEIQSKTNIPMNGLKRNLQSLAVAPRTRLLTKEPMSREINAGDKFSFNDQFKPNTIKIKVGVVSAGNKVEGDKERKETEKKNNDSRGYVIEAAIVRIMKQRKELPHAHLLTETLSVCAAQFKPDVNMIKKRIESLIERDYLERLEDAPVPSYKYMA
ncbi:Putative cullin protein, neddylation [Septoria linicola]|uniref:Cullin protein, neddylation n=1 Tax=Septoria linicola TaxID=215465 RepID=A0A9Q9AVG5_9PEZI|nr:Putative cullin protein, neddylation [Septoria linicola]